ncbi:hypothetical protein [Helicobacter pylori]|uniref:hypothetical protein n=1 Tax=Helicobacter pylori TaxID=210 RepID=UPI0015E69D9D|nr:hypothetical protein [Helicobacter pylori]
MPCFLNRIKVLFSSNTDIQSLFKFDNQRPIKKQSQKFSLTNSKPEKKRLKLCLEKTNANAKKSLEF